MLSTGNSSQANNVSKAVAATNVTPDPKWDWFRTYDIVDGRRVIAGHAYLRVEDANPVQRETDLKS